MVSLGAEVLEVGLELFKIHHGFASHGAMLEALEQDDWWAGIPAKWMVLAETSGSELVNSAKLGLKPLKVSEENSVRPGTREIFAQKGST